MRFKLLLIGLILMSVKFTYSQKSTVKRFSTLSCAEKWWVVWHPFVAKKALKVSDEARLATKELRKEGVLNDGLNGNGDQLDAFRHVYWMAKMVHVIGWRKAKRLGKAHEKGNYQDYKKRRLEEGVVPDKVGSDMDMFNNIIGLTIGMTNDADYIKSFAIQVILNGNCKVLRVDEEFNFLDQEGKLIPSDKLVGTWENEKCLMNSNEMNLR